jgi:hypothetical protein
LNIKKHQAIQLQIMEEEVVNYIEAPWDCQDLDPYRDDPKGDGGREVMGSDMIVDSREEPGAVDVDRPLCTCGGGCPEDMPTREEQLCCREVKTWQSEQSEGENLVSVAKYRIYAWCTADVECILELESFKNVCNRDTHRCRSYFVILPMPPLLQTHAASLQHIPEG